MHLKSLLLILGSIFVGAYEPAIGNTLTESLRPKAGVSKPKHRAARKVRILYIGNSAIYFHNLPEIVSGIAASGPDPIDIDSELIAEGGQTLQGHWLEGKAQREIHAKPWDYVVLQEQSCLNDEIDIGGIPCIVGWESYHRFAKMFDAEAKAVGAKTLILSLWSHKGTPPREQQALDYASQSLAREIGATLIPAGSVWRAMERRDKSVSLYYDGFHPTQAASYMFAVAFYVSVFRKSPANLAVKATGTDIGLDDQPGLDPHVVLVDVPKAQADEIKQVVYDVVRRGARTVDRPADPVMPSLPQGRAVTKGDVAGTWSGTETLFTSDPVPFTIDISANGDNLAADTHLNLRRPIEEKAIPGGLAGNVVWFENAKGVNNSFIRYRAVLVGNQLKGVAEVWQEKNLVSIGTFSAQRKL